MTYRVVRTYSNEIAVRNDDDDDLYSFRVRRDREPKLVLKDDPDLRHMSEPGKRPVWVQDAQRVAEAEAKRLGWV